MRDPESEPSVLRDAATWTQHRLGQRSFLRGTWSLSLRRLPWPLLQQAADWLFLWRSREAGAPLWIGWDVLERLKVAELPAAAAADLFVFGGEPFFAGENAPLWGELNAGQWLVPGTLLRIEGHTATLYLMTAEHPLAQEQLSARAATVARALTADAESTRGENLPAYQRRTDLPPRETWVQSIEEATRTMRGEELSKVVMSRCVRLEFTSPLEWSAWAKELLSIDEEAFFYLLRTPSGRTFMGRSPERLLAWDAEGFEIDAIAGTRGRALSREQDRLAARELQASPKERHEHRLVLGAIEETLDGAGLSYELREAEKLLKLRHVQHMRSRFAGRWPEAGASGRGFALLEELHPTPAVGGVPRPAALAFVKGEEAFDRGWFTGFIGLVQGVAAEFAIGIRSALALGRELYIFAGAGIVASSEPQAEWQETEQKMQNFLGLLPPSPQALRGSERRLGDATAESY